MTDGKEPIRMSAEDARTLATEPGFEQWDCGGVSMYLDASDAPRMGPITSARGPRAPRERLEPIPESAEPWAHELRIGGMVDHDEKSARMAVAKGDTEMISHHVSYGRLVPDEVA